jgi:hypothetical protein
VEEFAQENKIRGLLHLKTMREQPKLPPTNKKVIHLGASKVQSFF